jgi:two-component system sensor histidine kinase/response regulator
LDPATQQEILVVDDTPDNLRLLSAILMRKNYEVRKALNSTQAIASVKASAPDLILLDIKMPKVNGYEVCTMLKEDATTRDIPIIFISALDDALDKVQAFAVGGADSLTKPFQEDEVLARIENQLKIQHLQRQLKAQNQELRRSNQDLDQFAHIVSHDLQQPLQSIMGYSKLLMMQCSDTLDPAVKKHISSIVQAGDRMHKLVQHILQYAQADQSPSNFTQSPLNSIIKQVVSNLDSAIQQQSAQVTYGNLPIIYGDEIRLVQLFQNLIGNALKFTAPHTPPHIEIASAPHGVGTWLVTVKDNGIGIPQEHWQSIFDSFQRLHTEEQYPGNGIGLATCKKIVENHGGRIWVESQVGNGTTFYVVLPGAP